MTHFSLLKIAANQYMTLTFSFTNLYLRVLAFGIQEKIEERRMNLEFAHQHYKQKKRRDRERERGHHAVHHSGNSRELKEEEEEAAEMNLFLENTDFEIDPSVWALYQELKRFYDDLKRIHKTLRARKIHSSLPEVHYADHYNDIIAYWCQYQVCILSIF